MALLPASELAAESDSRCFGTSAKGRLENGVKLPSSGNNFVSYGTTPEILGRTYVHSRVKAALVEAFKHLETQAPGKRFMYAETGYAEGGPFRPHKTHQNGLSVDIMVPVTDRSGRSAYLPAHLFNRYGYDVEFDSTGQNSDFEIDFEALGALINAIHEAGRKNGAEVSRVLFAPDLQPLLYATKHGALIRQHVTIPTKKSWVRHDEHIHVDFDVPCEPLVQRR